MKPYHKIQSIFKRDPANKYRTFLDEYSLPEFEYLKDLEWMWTEKVDGTNIRVIWDVETKRVEFRGRSNKAEIPNPLMHYLETVFPRALFVTTFRDADVALYETFTLYGEGYGPKIQGGGKYRDDVSFILFDVKVGDVWLRREDVEVVADQLGIDVVEVIGYGTLHEAVVVAKAGYYSRIVSRPKAEGIVLRPAIELLDRRGQRIITKVKTKDFA